MSTLGELPMTTKVAVASRLLPSGEGGRRPDEGHCRSSQRSVRSYGEDAAYERNHYGDQRDTSIQNDPHPPLRGTFSQGEKARNPLT